MKDFAIKQARRLVFGIAVGCLVAIAVHLLLWDSKFLPTIRSNWVVTQSKFDGLQAYHRELLTLVCVVILAAFFSVGRISRYARAWWAGITSATAATAAMAALFLLESPRISAERFWGTAGIVLVGIATEYGRRNRSEHLVTAKHALILDVPKQKRSVVAEKHWSPTTDDPIEEWSEDLIGRSAIVELLAEHALVLRTPVIALLGGLGDGKSSVLNLLRRVLGNKAIVVSFSAWLPGDEASLATDLFRDIATECRKRVYVPQLRKRVLAYARIVSGSVSYLGGLKEILPTDSQKQEIEELKQSLTRVPLPIVVLLDEIDRMHKQELQPLLKLLRGAPTIPNTTFVCAFSDAEIRRKLLSDGELTEEYLEKFFPVTVRLSAPDPAMVGRIFKTRVTARFSSEPSWFGGASEQKQFKELLDQLWDDCISRVCTNFRKIGLLTNDIFAAARLIDGEVNAFDLVAIESLRRFYPNVYELVRQNSVFLTYEQSGWSKDRYLLRDDKKKADAKKFFESLASQISRYPDPDGAKGLLSYMFPAFDEAERALLHSHLRQTTPDSAWTEKRICHPEYFPVYFRAGVPEELLSNIELRQVLSELNRAQSESAAVAVLDRVLEENPKQHPRRDDALWKIGRSVNDLTSTAAEHLAFAVATRAYDYAYDLMNVGEAARALNIVFEVAQKGAATQAVQRTLLGAMVRAADDTFALRLLEYTENKDRNKILLDFKNVDVPAIRKAFMDRMRSRYGPSAAIESVDILRGDWRAFREWTANSPEDREIEQNFWRRYIGQSRKRLAQAINFLYPSGYTWSEDPRTTISQLFPVDEIGRLIECLGDEQLDEVEAKGIERFRELLGGKWFDIRRPDF